MIITTNEKIIRKLLRNKYQKQYPNAIIRDEFTSLGLNTRNDLFLVDDSIIISFEIKSNRDTLKRLRSQITEYKTYSSMVVIALDIKHVKKFEKDFEDLVDDNLTVYVYNDYELINYIDGIPKEFPNLLNLLWSSELLLFREGLKGRSKLPKSSIASKKMINAVFSQEEISQISKYLFVKRLKDEPHKSKIKKYKPDIKDDDIKDLILEHQERFTKYLKEL